MSQIAIVPLLIYWSMTVTAPAWAAPLALFMGLMCLSNAVGFAGGALTGEMFRFRRHERKEAEMKPTWTDSYYYRRHGFAGLRWFYRIWFSLMFLILAGLLAAVVCERTPEPCVPRSARQRFGVVQPRLAMRRRARLTALASARERRSSWR